MATALEELRAELARSVDAFFAGAATGGSTTTIIDTAGLARWTEDDALKGAVAYIRSAGSAAPEDEWRWIKTYAQTSQTITVDRAFSAAVESGDTYELYLAPLPLEAWTDCVNLAIEQSWPEMFERDVSEWPICGSGGFTLSDPYFDQVERVLILPGGALAGYPAAPLAPSEWFITGTPGVDLELYLNLPFEPIQGQQIRIIGRLRHAQLAAGESSDIDEEYLLAAGRANWYQAMVGASREKAAGRNYLQLMAHWQMVAEQRKQVLLGTALGLEPVKEGKKK